MNLSHRLRLALASATAAGVVLAILFTAIVIFSRRDVLEDKKTEIRAVTRSFTSPTSPSFDLDEFHEAHPDLSATAYDLSGSRIRSVGHNPPALAEGFVTRGHHLVFGTPFKGQRIVLSLDLHEAERGLGRLTTALVSLWLPLTLLVGGATWIAAQSVFRPLSRLNAQALAMSGTNLSERLETPDRAEFGEFAQGLNQMLDRIEETVRRGERFSADAAHELRTPLAILRTRLETTLLQPRTAEGYETVIGRSVAEIGRLTAITESLLRSARGTSEPAPEVDLRALVGEAVERWEERFGSAGVRLQERTDAATVSILPEEIRILMDNLLANALRYAPPDTHVVVSLCRTGGEARVTVEDRGPGVPAELGESIFDRFVRADDSRNRASGGTGIGLSVCRQIVVSRSGEMILGTNPGGGAIVGFRLPTAS